MARRDDSPLSLQLTWHENSLHLWALNSADCSVAHVVELLRAVDQRLGRYLSLSALPGRIPVQLPEPFGPTPAPTLRIHLGNLDELSPRQESSSLRWFAAVACLAVTTLRAGRVRPLLEIAGPVHIAHWVPITDHPLESSLAELHANMPPVCGVIDIARFFEVVVDATVRRTLANQAWRPPQPRQGRGTDYRAAQATFRALASAAGSVLYRHDDLPALAALDRTLGREAERAAGLAVLDAQLRLHLPDAIDEPWRITLELVDIDQPDHWCTAADVFDGTPLALDLARRADQLPRLRERIADAGALLGDHLGPLLAPFKVFGDDPAAVAELAIDQVETFLVSASALLDEIDIRLLGPEQLLRAKAGMRAAATPRPESATSGRFTAGALVQWNATVDDSPIDDAQLERAAASGSSLIHVNGRWVRLDTQQVRTTLDRLHTHREQHTELDVASLMKLAAEAAAGVVADAGSTSLVAVDSTGWIDESFVRQTGQQLGDPASAVDRDQ